MEESTQPRGSFATPLLVGLLVIASFFVGTLYTKVQMLEKNANTAGVVAGAKAGTQPTAVTSDPTPGPETVGDVPPITAADHIRGNKDAKVILVEYSDYECPFCKRYHPTMQQLMQDYGDKIGWVYRHFPLSFHANAQKEAEAAECVAELGGNDAFWKFSDKIYERTAGNGTGFALTALRPLAIEVGVNGNAFQQCLDSGKFAQKVKDQQDGGIKAGINGTPGTIILPKEGKPELVSGAVPVDQLKASIDKYLQ